MEPDLDFVIVGGGIGGAVFAALLGRAGRRCVVLEKGSAPMPIPRPEILRPATVSLLSELIPGPELRDRAMLRGLVFARGTRVIAGVTPEMMRRAAFQPTSSDPSRTRGPLLRHGSFEVKPGSRRAASGATADASPASAHE